MSRCPRPEDLSAFLDDELDAERQVAIGRHVDRCDEDAARLASYRRLDQALREAAGLVQDDPPHRLKAALADGIARRRRHAAIAASVALLSLALGGVWWIAGPGSHPAGELDVMARDAGAAFRVYAVEQPTLTLRPARAGQALEAWLTQRLGRPVPVPDLQRFGFHLAQEQMLATERGPAAQLVYLDVSGRRLTCLFMRRAAGPDEALRYRVRDGVTTAYGADDDLAYAMTSRLDRAELRGIAEAIYPEPSP